jgi:hypothetical protein
LTIAPVEIVVAGKAIEPLTRDLRTSVEHCVPVAIQVEVTLQECCSAIRAPLRGRIHIGAPAGRYTVSRMPHPATASRKISHQIVARAPARRIFISRRMCRWENVI